MDSPVLERVSPPPPTCERAFGSSLADIFLFDIYTLASLFVGFLIQEWHFTVWFTADGWPSLTWRISPLGNDSTFLLFIYLSRVPCLFCLLHQGPFPFPAVFILPGFGSLFLVYLRRPPRHSGPGSHWSECLGGFPLHSPNSRLRLSIDHLNPTRPAATATAPSTSFLPAASHTQGPPFSFFFLLLRCTYCKYMYAVSRSPTPPTRAVFPMCPCPNVHKSTVSTLLVWNLSAAWTPSWHSFFYYYCYLFFISNDEMVFLLSLDRRCIATDDRISALDGTHNKNRATW